MYLLFFIELYSWPGWGKKNLWSSKNVHFSKVFNFAMRPNGPGLDSLVAQFRPTSHMLDTPALKYICRIHRRGGSYLFNLYDVKVIFLYSFWNPFLSAVKWPLVSPCLLRKHTSYTNCCCVTIKLHFLHYYFATVYVRVSSKMYFPHSIWVNVSLGLITAEVGRHDETRCWAGQ